MNQSKKYLNQFFLLLAWIFFVILFFKLIPEKKVAAVLAGTGFVFWPLLFIYKEFKREQKSILHLTVLFIFLLTNALPIYLLRLLNWNSDFSSLSLFGIEAEKFHAVSNILYIALMGSCLFLYFRTKKRERS